MIREIIEGEKKDKIKKKTKNKMSKNLFNRFLQIYCQS